MRWKNTREFPVEGEIRIVTRFLWFPVTIEGMSRWWEEATIQQKYYLDFHLDGAWENVRWLN